MTERLRQMGSELRSVPDAMAAALNGWVMRQHTYPEHWPHEMEPAPCIHCRKPWPCPEWTAAADRRSVALKAKRLRSAL